MLCLPQVLGQISAVHQSAPPPSFQEWLWNFDWHSSEAVGFLNQSKPCSLCLPSSLAWKWAALLLVLSLKKIQLLWCLKEHRSNSLSRDIPTYFLIAIPLTALILCLCVGLYSLPRNHITALYTGLQDKKQGISEYSSLWKAGDDSSTGQGFAKWTSSSFC